MPVTGPGAAKFPHMFQPAKLGSLTAPNRVKYAACSVSNFNTPDGHITPREFARMDVVAATGAGIITNQGAYPDPRGEGKAYFRQLSIADDRYIPGLAKTADLIHKQGAVALQQILHGGRYGGIELAYCSQPSDVAQTLKHFRPPKTMSKEEIRACVRDHAEAARRAITAGFDGIEITAFMGYLLANFLSPFTNKRQDEYGGSLEYRGRFLREIIESVKTATGGRPLVVRLNGEELMDEYGGTPKEECLEFMRMAERSGADCISIVVGWHESRRGALGRDVPTDTWLPLARRAKEAVGIPVAFGPRFGSPLLAEKALGEGSIDFWEVCRPFLADPQLLQKVAEDRVTEIRPCVGDLTCLARMFRNLPYICTMNARLGHEVEPEYEVRPAVVKKRVTVIGAGPAGLECALTAARRGHAVTILEKESRIGGQLHAASKEVGGGGIFMDVIAYFETMIKKHGIDLKLGVEADEDACSATRADVLVLAAGARLGRATIPADGMPILDAYDVLLGKVEAPAKSLVLGGERLGLVTAEHLASQGRRVTVVEGSRRLADDVTPTFKWRHLAWLKEYGIPAHTGSKIESVANGRVVLALPAGKKAEVEADAIILASPRESRQELLRPLEYAADELHVIGDAIQPRSLTTAIHEGYRLGVRI